MSLSEYIETAKDGTALSLMDVVCTEEDLFDDLAQKEAAAKLHRSIDKVLDERERTVVVLRYGLGERVPCTQREIAKRLGISRSYVSRIEKKALEKLEQVLKE